MSSIKSRLLLRPDYLVCTCMGVMYSEICQAIEDGYVMFDDLSDFLLVGTGCNSCVSEVKDILQKQLSNE